MFSEGKIALFNGGVGECIPAREGNDFIHAGALTGRSEAV